MTLLDGNLNPADGSDAVTMMLRRVEDNGAHAKIRVWFGRGHGHRGMAGVITVRSDEWAEWVELFDAEADEWDAAVELADSGFEPLNTGLTADEMAWLERASTIAVRVEIQNVDPWRD